jgi:hypothetical protein
MKNLPLQKILSLHFVGVGTWEPVIRLTSRKLGRCTGKLLKIKSKLILIHFTSYVEYVLFSFFFFVVQNIVGKINKETLQIGFRINLIF